MNTHKQREFKEYEKFFFDKDPGELGLIMRAMVEKAIQIIRVESRHVVAETKMSYDGVFDDVVTSGDKLAQAMYEEEIKRHFPTFGIIGEENALRLLSQVPGHDVYFTVDPLDGTKAYKRQQSNGVGTMIALVFDGEVIAAYIGDINTGEIFGFDATIDKPSEVHRYRFGHDTLLVPNLTDPLHMQYVYTRGHPANEAPWVQRLVTPSEFGGFFKDMEGGGGSIGTAMARLWKGEVGAAVLNTKNITPWDETPVVGIGAWLGFEFLKLKTDPRTKKTTLVPTTKALIKEVQKTPPDNQAEVIVHKHHVPELMAWLARNLDM